MKLFRKTTWNWYDIALLKWSVLLFGMIAGAYFSEVVQKHFWLFLVAAVLLAIRPVVVYFRQKPQPE